MRSCRVTDDRGGGGGGGGRGRGLCSACKCVVVRRRGHEQARTAGLPGVHCVRMHTLHTHTRLCKHLRVRACSCSQQAPASHRPTNAPTPPNSCAGVNRGPLHLPCHGRQQRHAQSKGKQTGARTDVALEPWEKAGVGASPARPAPHTPAKRANHGYVLARYLLEKHGADQRPPPPPHRLPLWEASKEPHLRCFGYRNRNDIVLVCVRRMRAS